MQNAKLCRERPLLVPQMGYVVPMDVQNGRAAHVETRPYGVSTHIVGAGLRAGPDRFPIFYFRFISSVKPKR